MRHIETLFQKIPMAVPNISLEVNIKAVWHRRVSQGPRLE